jgi:hypothetical protein
VIIAVNHLMPVLSGHVSSGQADWDAIDAALPLIQTEREPEIIQIQKLQQAEIGQARLLRGQPLLRQMVSRLAPIIGGRIRYSWLDRQRQLRQGLAIVRLIAN